VEGDKHEEADEDENVDESEGEISQHIVRKMYVLSTECED
jgi:hypothetical protein